MGRMQRFRSITLGAIALAALTVSGAPSLFQGYVSPSRALAQDTPAGPASQSSNAVTISNFTFEPDMLEAPVGATVTWTNTDGATHTVTSDDGAFDSGDLATDADFSEMFMSAGTFAYHCQIHPFMTATVKVGS